MNAKSMTTPDTDATDFMYAPEVETLPRDDLVALQLERLGWSLAHAYDRVPHYRDALDRAGVKPGDIKTLADMTCLPFTTKDVLRDHYPFGLFAVPREELARLHASSGTTGKPTVVGYTAKDLDIWADLMARAMVAAGVRPGDLVHNAYGYGLFTGGLGFHDGAQRLGCTVLPISGGLTERQVLLLHDFGARVLFATPSYAINIAETADAAGVDLAAGPLEIGMFGAEPSSEAMRQEIEARLGIRSFNHFGLSEIMGPGVAAECTAQAGLHIWEDHFIYEVIDPDTGEEMPAGAQGELVITTLTKEALPMIRYRTRDITGLIDEPCACGRTHRRIEHIAGRNDDMLIIRGVNVFPSQIEAVLVGFPGIAPHYQLVVERDGALDTLAIEAEATPQSAADDDARTNLARAMQNHIKSLIGVTCSVAVKAPGTVPRSEGKAVRVRDLR